MSPAPNKNRLSQTAPLWVHYVSPFTHHRTLTLLPMPEGPSCFDVGRGRIIEVAKMERQAGKA